MPDPGRNIKERLQMPLVNKFICKSHLRNNQIDEPAIFIDTDISASLLTADKERLKYIRLAAYVNRAWHPIGSSVFAKAPSRFWTKSQLMDRQIKFDPSN